jgi:hypothetical protein
MKPFEFIVILVFIVFGMAISEVIISIGNTLRQIDQILFYPPLLFWMMTGWMMTIQYFFSFYRLQKIQVWTVPNFGIVIFTTVTYVLTTYLVVPDNQSLDMQKYFRHNANAIYFTVIAMLFSMMAEAYYLHQSRKVFNYIITLLFIALLATGIIFNTIFTDYLISITIFAFQLFMALRTRKIIAEPGAE